MSTIHWFDAFNSGNKDIDSAHKQIVIELNKFIELQTQCESYQLSPFFHRITDLAMNSFYQEEIILEDCGYDGIKQHCREHQLIIDKIDHFYQLEKGNENRVFVYFALIYLRDFWFYHMFREVLEFQQLKQATRNIP